MTERANWFVPILAGASLQDRVIACVGAVLGIAAATYAGTGLDDVVAATPYLFASIGASAVLVFAVPASPLAQPWPVVGGNVISALVGIATLHLIDDPYAAGPIAVGGAILAMSLLRCLHPPGGGTALVPILGGTAITSLGYSFAFTTVAINAVALVLAGWCFHRFTHHSYPHKAVPTPQAQPAGLIRADIDAALAETGETFDISPADLEALLLRAEAIAAKRTRR